MNTEPKSSDNAQPINQVPGGAIVRTVPAPTLEELLAGREPFLFHYSWDNPESTPRIAWKFNGGGWMTRLGPLLEDKVSHYALLPQMIAVERKG